MNLPIFQRTVVDDAGNIIAGATVTITNEATGLAATIYSDRNGSVPLTNPFTTGSDGLAKFYAAAGEYRIQATSGSTSVDWRYQVLSGTAAILDSVESNDDSTEGRVLIVGSGGLLGDAVEVPDFNTVEVNGIYKGESISAGVPYSGNWEMQHIQYDENSAAQLIWNAGAATVEMFTRVKTAGNWQAHKEVLHTGNTGSIVDQDYEEGSWTPTAGVGLTSVSFISFQPEYVKIGRKITGFAYVDLVKDGAGTSFRIGGLPFTAASPFGSVDVFYKDSANQNVNYYRSYVNVASDEMIFEATSSIPDSTAFELMIGFSYFE